MEEVKPILLENGRQRRAEVPFWTAGWAGLAETAFGCPHIRSLRFLQ